MYSTQGLQVAVVAGSAERIDLGKAFLEFHDTVPETGFPLLQKCRPVPERFFDVAGFVQNGGGLANVGITAKNRRIKTEPGKPFGAQFQCRHQQGFNLTLQQRVI